MANYFNTLSLNEINSSLTYTCISDIKDELQAEITAAQQYALNKIEISNGDTTRKVIMDAEYSSFSQYTADAVIIGTGATGPPYTSGWFDDGGLGVIIGTDSIHFNADTCVTVGCQSSINGYTGGNVDYQAQNNILIGCGTSLSNPAGITGANRNNVVIAHNSDVNNGNHNTVINSNTHGGQLNNNILIGETNGSPSEGAMCFGGHTGYAPSTLPRFQLLSDGLVNLQGSVVGNAYNSGVTFSTPANINGYLRLRYKGKNLLIPVIEDADDATNSPAAV